MKTVILYNIISLIIIFVLIFVLRIVSKSDLRKNQQLIIMLAFLISPMGLPLLAVQGLGKLQDMNTAMKNFIHS